jgi:hypothetical protein
MVSQATLKSMNKWNMLITYSEVFSRICLMD